MEAVHAGVSGLGEGTTHAWQPKKVKGRTVTSLLLVNLSVGRALLCVHTEDLRQRRR